MDAVIAIVAKHIEAALSWGDKDNGAQAEASWRMAEVWLRVAESKARAGG